MRRWMSTLLLTSAFLVGLAAAPVGSASGALVQKDAAYSTSFSWKSGGGPGVKSDTWRLYLPDRECASAYANNNGGHCTFQYYFSKTLNRQVMIVIYSGVVCDATVRAKSFGTFDPDGFPESASGTMSCNSGSGG